MSMHKYRIHYRDSDPGCPVFTTIVRACDRAHAEEKFFDDPDDDWEIVKIERVRAE